jgi:predicted ABC-type ATPase
VPELTVRRRYETGLRNFFRLYRPLATSWRFYDNTHTPRLLAEGRGPVVTVHDKSLWSRLEGRYLRGSEA